MLFEILLFVYAIIIILFLAGCIVRGYTGLFWFVASLFFFGSGVLIMGTGIEYPNGVDVDYDSVGDVNSIRANYDYYAPDYAVGNDLNVIGWILANLGVWLGLVLLAVTALFSYAQFKQWGSA